MIPPIVDVQWWRQRQGAVVLADVRWCLDGRSGLEAYRAGHLPGALFVDLDRWLADDSDPSRGRHPLPEPEVFAEGMAQLGETEPVDPRAGHIPGARNLPTRGHLDDSGRFLPIENLRERFAVVGVHSGDDVVSYCGSGVTACHNLLALEYAGLGQGWLYPGSWSEYSSQPDREVATGDDDEHVDIHQKGALRA